MIFDANDFPDTTHTRSEVCIVGGGAAGIALALRLARHGRNVLLLESGGLRPEADTQALYEGHVADEKLHSPTDRYRIRTLGGSTTAWGGRCVPFDPIDFEQRPYIEHSGWPIPYGEVARYYADAASLAEAGPSDFIASDGANRAMRPMIVGFEGRYFTTDSVERFSRPTDFGHRYRDELANNPCIRVVLHANVTRIRMGDDTTAVVGIVARSLSGKTIHVQADAYVLAAGGIETPRLLLANHDVCPAGIGNDHDVVGRYYMCHLAGTIGAFSYSGSRADIFHGYDRDNSGVYCRRRLALEVNAQRAHQVGSFVARLHHPRITDPDHKSGVLSLLYLAKPFIPYEYRKRLHGDGPDNFRTWLRHLFNVVRAPADAVFFAWHMLRDRKLADRKFPSIIVKPRASLFSIDFHAEQLPNPESRVTLSGDVDVLGVPRVLVDWNYLPGDVHTVQASLALLAEDLTLGGRGHLDYAPDSVEAEMTRYGAYGGHHIGTTRMGTDPRSSVVDPNCRVHGITNLFVAGSSVFPTSSQANPTLTIIAMALRLADHLAASGSGDSQRRMEASASRQIPMTRRILVLGASGFIGRAVVSALARQTGYSVVAASRHIRPDAVPPGVAPLALDVTDAEAVRAAVSTADAVVNCIAGSADSIVRGCEHLVAACRAQANAPRIIHLSTLAVYGSTEGEVTERSDVRDDQSPYGSAKIRAESMLADYPNACILRPGIVYGPGSTRWSGELADLLLARRLGDLGAGGEGVCNLVHVDDVVKAIVRTLEPDPACGRIYNLSTPLPLSWNRYFSLYARALGVVDPPRISRLRLGVEVYALGPPLKVFEILRGRVGRVVPKLPIAIRPWLMSLCRQKIHMRVDAIERDLGFRFVPVEDGLVETARWALGRRNRP